MKEIYDKVYTKREHPYGEGKPDGIVSRMIEQGATGSALELGVGNGRNALFLASQGLKVTGVDYSPVGLEKFKQRAEAAGSNIKAIEADLETWDIDQVYDNFVVSFVLQHLDHDRAVDVLRQIQDKTKAGGFNSIAAFTKESDFFREEPKTQKFFPEVGRLRSFYAGWDVLEYEEKAVKTLKKNEQGEHMSNTTAYLLARKPVK